MKYFTVNTKPEIPEIIREKSMPDWKNAWVSPSGDFWGFDGSMHLRVATYICIFQLDIHPDHLDKGTYFKESFDTRLSSLGWLEIKDSTWLSSTYATNRENPPLFYFKNEPTQKQMDTVFDYCEKHGLDYPFKN